MEFSFSSKVEKISEFYKSMGQLSIQIGTFEHKYNDVTSDVIFDTRNEKQWNLLFIKRGMGETLVIPLNMGYRFTIEGNKKYNEFIIYFGIRSGKGQFSIKEFVSNLNIQVPNEYKLSDDKRKVVINYDKLDSESDGIFPIGVTNWEVAHAKNPTLPKDKYHRTSKNLLKTKELYPAIYQATKDIDITIIYGTSPGDKMQELRSCKFE